MVTDSLSTGLRDPHSFAQPDLVRIEHLDLDLQLDFERQTAFGSASYRLFRADPKAPLVLDVQGLRIERVLGTDGTQRTYDLGPERAGLGRAMIIPLAARDHGLRIEYSTEAGAEALQWLSPEQTAGGQDPFLFSQGQAVLTRTWIPIQDTPGVRLSYDARIHCPAPLTVVMSAEQVGRDSAGAFLFRMPNPIPPYLIALACGNLVSRELSPRVAVWAEPATIDAAASEFRDTEAMIRSAESLYGPYLWGRYDLLILPPAFPYGGMENPLLTFVTPTVIAGDRSLVSLIAHELAHSWSGNLVTNATWSDFWLNEGFTVYFEKRIMENLYGADRAAMEMVLDRRDLELSIDRFEPWKTVLRPDIRERHPDDSFSNIPYQKGALFLRRLEQAFGREEFDGFLRSWFEEHRFRSVGTDEFLEFLRARLLTRDPIRASQIDLVRWIDQPGLPADAPRAHSPALELVEREFERFCSGIEPKELSTSGWVSQQWLHFIDQLRQRGTGARLAALDRVFGWTSTGNAEIRSAWLTRAIQHNYAAADAAIESFVTSIGRRKLLQPIYEELCKSPAGKAKAKALYGRARPRYHAVTRGTLDKLLGWDS